MVPTPFVARIALIGPDEDPRQPARGCRLWPVGYAGAVQESGAELIPFASARGLTASRRKPTEVHGIIWTAAPRESVTLDAQEWALWQWCRKGRVPVLAVDHGLHLLNAAAGGSTFLDLGRERPESIQHLHPPEPGLRHAIAIDESTRLAEIYGEGEHVVNSAHRRGIDRLGRGFRVAARALDGVVEAIESEDDGWFVLGIQWRPAAGSASGLDIQIFRSLVQACEQRQRAGSQRRKRLACTHAA